MAKAKKAQHPTPLWTPDFSLAPRGTIGACFNADGSAWWWSVKPEVKGSEKRSWDLKWRGPEYSKGFTFYERVPFGTKLALWRDSWVDAPKASK
jgi:hypothetical protein